VEEEYTNEALYEAFTDWLVLQPGLAKSGLR